jgi:hypothetical protein
MATPCVVARLCPLLHIAPDETLRPCTLQRFEDLRAGRSSTATATDGDAPLYYRWDAAERHVTYVHVYPADGGLHGVGGHAGDVEFVRFYYAEAPAGDAGGVSITRAYYAAHGRDQGAWVEGRRVPRDSATGRPLVFVARSTHASYPAPGCWPRIFFVGNDHAYGARGAVAVADGGVWDPADALVPLSDDPALLPPGLMQWRADAHELTGVPRGRVAATLYRLLYPLSKGWTGAGRSSDEARARARPEQSSSAPA